MGRIHRFWSWQTFWDRFPPETHALPVATIRDHDDVLVGLLWWLPQRSIMIDDSLTAIFGSSVLAKYRKNVSLRLGYNAVSGSAVIQVLRSRLEHSGFNPIVSRFDYRRIYQNAKCPSHCHWDLRSTSQRHHTTHLSWLALVNASVVMFKIWQCFSTSVPWHTGTRDIVRSTTRSGYFNQRLFHPVRLYLPPSTHPWKCRHGATAGERRMLSRCFAFSFNHAGPRLRSWFERIDLR